jgi:signal transduction histidine kinase
LRTPLTSLRGAVKLLEAGAGGSLPEKARGLASIAAQGSDRLLAILNDLLDLDRMASSSMNFQLAAVDAAEALSQVARAFEGLAMSQHVQLRVHAPAGLMLMADPQRLQQVLGNLVSNAIKFAPDASAVELEAHAEPGPASSVWLGVTDHGPGIPESFRPRVFQRFAQADQRTNRAQGGSGLGLSIVKAMVEQMNGSVGFESEPGRTLFHIRLPGAAA